MATVSAIFGTGVYGASEYGVTDVSVPISSVSATGTAQSVAVNGFEIDISERITTGVAGTGFAGSVTANTAAGLTGVAGTGAINDDLDIRSVKIANATGVVGTTAVNGNVNIVVVIDQVTGVGATASLGSIDTKVKEPLSSVAGTSALGTITTTAVVTSFVASAYDRNHVVTVLPKQTSSQRRAA